MSETPKKRPWLRGAVWIGVGAVVYGVGMAAGYPLFLRYTRIPLGFVIAGIGGLVLGYDLWKAGRASGAD